MDFDIIGTLIFLWFIFRGIQNSKKAKRQSANRQKERPVAKTTPKETTTIPMPSWFPFPIEIPTGEVIKKEEKRQVTPKVKSLIPEEEKVPVKPKVREKAISTVIEMQEKEWRNEDPVFNLDERAVINGVIWSEVLGPPRAKRKFAQR